MNSDQTTDFANEVGKLRGLMEDQNSKLDRVLEAVGDIKARVETLTTRDEFNELKPDVKTIKVAVTATNHDVAALDQRVTQLEET